jgi:alpha-glucosidase (family GH31 glycosyl hydrolase)
MFGKPYLPPFWSLGWQEVTSQTVYDPTHQFEGDNQTTITQTLGHYLNQSYPIEAIYLD